MATQLKMLASKVLFALSLNNFNAVFSRISSRLVKQVFKCMYYLGLLVTVQLARALIH